MGELVGGWAPIPGETPIDDLSGLKVEGVTNREQLSAVEAKNILKATVRYLAAPPSKKVAPFDLAWAKKLHAEMFGDVWQWAGKSRTSGTNLGVEPYLIDTELAALFGDLEAWAESDMPLIEQAARLHHRAVWIHPFPNGNGRWARMLADIWLYRNGHPPIAWPAEINGSSPIREQYLNALKNADGHDLEALFELYGTLAEAE